MAQITIYYSGFTSKGTGSGDELYTRTIRGSISSLSGKKNINYDTNANGGEIVEVNTQSYENISISIQDIKLVPNSESSDTFITWDDILTLYKMNYNGTNAPVLNITYGDSTSVKGANNSTDIKVILESMDMNMNTRDVKNAYLPTVNLNFIETK